MRPTPSLSLTDARRTEQLRLRDHAPHPYIREKTAALLYTGRNSA